ncbi:hypothetical protein L249_2546 [Ophiocordyceps polyrhachis-furcata BCC 54312]|uniref:Cyclin-D1-binding protein 1-like N-terminal domain-containing protein n=1 Tax=Ophiocordyceps polyrhachis-furcata BCC 54312 TaxID=1330021 RepID=A0A367LQQ3_9HYPO|nr:hypothetical protein L249_2546 [Ophiocordyceps polyrhachis-furcata BCC 54312]
MAPSPPSTNTNPLDNLLASASSLLSQLQSSLNQVVEESKDAEAPPTPSPTPSSSSDNSLSQTRDATKLIRLHGTKISPLVTHGATNPSTPPTKALSTVVIDLVGGPVPTLVSAAQSCRCGGLVLRRELALLAGRVLAALDGLLRSVAIAVVDQEHPSVRATAVLWSACDALVDLSSSAPAGFFVAKARQSEDLLNDVALELREWDEQEPDEEDDDEDDDDVQDTDSLSAQSLADSFLSPKPIPQNDLSNIRPRLTTTLRLLRLVALLLGIAHKRRLPDIVPDSRHSPRLDALARQLDRLPEHFEDLAASLYAMQPTDVDDNLRLCMRDAETVAGLLADGWDGLPDRFTGIVDRFRQELKHLEGDTSSTKMSPSSPASS